MNWPAGRDARGALQVDQIVRRALDLDRRIGSRIRVRRLSVQLSQEELAARVGITFQQIQKYEKGVNRVSASRLVQLADALGVPALYFFQGEDKYSPELQQTLATNDGIELANLFVKVREPALRRLILRLVRTLAEGGD